MTYCSWCCIWSAAEELPWWWHIVAGVVSIRQRKSCHGDDIVADVVSSRQWKSCHGDDIVADVVSSRQQKSCHGDDIVAGVVSSCKCSSDERWKFHGWYCKFLCFTFLSCINYACARLICEQCVHLSVLPSRLSHAHIESKLLTVGLCGFYLCVAQGLCGFFVTKCCGQCRRGTSLVMAWNENEVNKNADIH